MRHGSLFSGIGGFDLAAEWMGWENVFHCEINDFCNRILNYYWPNAKSYTDIKTTDFNVWRGKIDIITGGFPCQPYSISGKRKGKTDDRHLWPEMLRAIREIQPRWVVGENVPGLLNWQRGMVLKEIKTDLENEGFEVFPPLIIPACSKDAPHRRDRLWIVAHNNNRDRTKIGLQTRREINVDGPEGTGFVVDTTSQGLEKRKQSQQERPQKKDRARVVNRTPDDGLNGITTDTQASGVEGSGTYRQQEPQTQIGSGLFGRNGSGDYWANWPTQPPVCSGNDGLPGQLDGITIPKHRKESLMGYGNAIVPQVAYEIFKTIEQYEHQV